MEIFQFPSGLLGDEKSVELIEMILLESKDPFSRRQFAPGHVTATGLVFHPDGERIAMVLHGRLKRWLLPGGHVEAVDMCIISAAAREVLEETGLIVKSGRIVGADVHGIPRKEKGGIEIEPYHLHHDVLIGFQTESAELKLSNESEDLKWVWPSEFDSFVVPPNVRRAYSRFFTD